MIVWVLTDNWTQDLEHGLTVNVYTTLGEAQEYMQTLVAEVKDWQDYDEEEEDDMHYEGWSAGDYNNYHTSITIEQKVIREVKE